jgi:hypothetical protein
MIKPSKEPKVPGQGGKNPIRAPEEIKTQKKFLSNWLKGRIL